MKMLLWLTRLGALLSVVNIGVLLKHDHSLMYYLGFESAIRVAIAVGMSFGFFVLMFTFMQNKYFKSTALAALFVVAFVNYGSLFKHQGIESVAGWFGSGSQSAATNVQAASFGSGPRITAESCKRNAATLDAAQRKQCSRFGGQKVNTNKLVRCRALGAEELKWCGQGNNARTANCQNKAVMRSRQSQCKHVKPAK